MGDGGSGRTGGYCSHPWPRPAGAMDRESRIDTRPSIAHRRPPDHRIKPGHMPTCSFFDDTAVVQHWHSIGLNFGELSSCVWGQFDSVFDCRSARRPYAYDAMSTKSVGDDHDVMNYLTGWPVNITFQAVKYYFQPVNIAKRMTEHVTCSTQSQ